MNKYWDFNRLSSNRTLQLGIVIFCLSMGGCSWIPKGESDLDVGIKERGVASWYGVPFHGRLAANGEVFDMEAMTAAHRTLPLGSMVRVVNLLNGKHVRVRINDRGPYVNGRILDLSHAAAAQLGMVEGGLSVIQLEVIGDHRPEFVVKSEEGTLYATPHLVVHRLDERSLIALTMHRLGRSSFTNASIHRLLPNDVLVQRWWELAPAILAADPAHREHAVLVLA
jgi:rare lipoprotein A